jgi:hypothetical protein
MKTPHEQRREAMEWMLIGYLLGHPERAKEADSWPQNTLSAERRRLHCSMQSGKNGQDVLDWFAESKFPVEKGRTAIETLLHAITAMNERTLIEDTMKRLRMSTAEYETAEQLADKLDQLAARLRKVKTE